MIPHFEALHNMEAFSDAMFNRIIAFQERQHPAWNNSLTFAERIKDLPLHYLVFSNPDRDPARFGPTVSPIIPLRDEMRRIATYIRQVSTEPVVCDFHAGNGFVGSLLAREGLMVTGIRDPGAKPYQIKDFYDRDCYELRDMAMTAVNFPFDVAFSCWMPAGQNCTPEILRHQPKLVVFIHTKHVNEQTGEPQTGTPEAYTNLPASYQLIHEWGMTRPKDVFHAIWPDLTPSIEETRYVKVYAAEGYHDIDIPDELPLAEPYDWEQELEMALLARQAMEHLRAHGIQM